MNRLQPILAATREAVAVRRRLRPEPELRDSAERRRAQAGERRDFRSALAAPGLSVIAEHKRRSPSAGPIREDLSLAEVVGAYERGGAAAVSVLTEEPSFGGSLADLAAARAACGLPLLRKDFIVDRYQVVESAAAGADAILLIVAALPGDELAELHATALALGLAVLVEVHDGAELARAVDAGAEVIGINNRDLTTLQVDTGRALQLLGEGPEGAVTVAESGYDRPEQLAELAAAGFDAVLIGEALMRSVDIEAACRVLTGMRVAR